MDEGGLFTAAARGLSRAVDAVGDGQWGERLPEGSRPGQEPATVREGVGGSAIDLAWVPDVLAGHGAEDAAPARREGDLLGEHPAAAVRTLVDAAVGAVAHLEDPERTTHLSYGDFPAREYLQHVSTYYGLLALDVAMATGHAAVVSDELVQGLWELLAPQADQWRAIGVFGPQVQVPDDAPLRERLMGLTGRRP